MKNKNTVSIAFAALFTALISVFSQIYLPTPTMPITLQTFAVALCGFMLSVKWSTACVLTYIVIGAFGLPVFSAFKGGAQILIGPTGGFIWGFIILGLACSLAVMAQRSALKIILCAAGLLLCHLAGIIQYSILTSTNIFICFVITSLPFILKDIVSLLGASLLSKYLKKRIKGLKF